MILSDHGGKVMAPRGPTRLHDIHNQWYSALTQSHMIDMFHLWLELMMVNEMVSEMVRWLMIRLRIKSVINSVLWIKVIVDG